MQARIDELQERLQQVELTYEESQKQSTVLQVKLDEALKEQGLLEENVHEHTERINDLESEKKESVRARREMEQIYESERAAALKEKEEAAIREEEMQLSMQRLKESLAQREMRAGLDEDRKPHLSRQSSNLARSSNPSPTPDSFDRQFAPSSIERSDSSSRSSSKLILQKDKLIESLRLELAEAQIKLVEMENMGGGRMQELQRQMYEIKMQNARLMEENESFQLLLSEKTLNGDFLRAPSTTGSRPPSQPLQGATLADELESQEDGEGGEEVRRLQAEVNGMKDQNKALTLYINNIISRLLQHEQFEQILDKTPDLMAGPGAASRKHIEAVAAGKEKELPPSPVDKDGEEVGTGFLQRAKSVIGSRPRPRPQSQIYSGDMSKPLPELLKLNEDPSTAPSVPIGRSSSVRNSMGHRRANSDWPAASLVTNMYRGASPAMSPLSPGLSSPTRGTSFFGPGAGLRATSTSSAVPSIAETTTDGLGKENHTPPLPSSSQQRDSKISDKRHSILSNDSSLDDPTTHPSTSSSSSHAHPAPPKSTPSSPPRSLASTDTKDSSAKPTGAIMMGSRMRPLRLVQENVDQEKAAAAASASAGANNRSSWFGWMNKGLPGMPGLPGAAAGSAATTPTTNGPMSGLPQPQSPPRVSSSHQHGIVRAATMDGGGHS
jgi:hypothetical protein